MKDWFTADTHFGHEAVLRYSRRPFATVEEMNEEIVRRWNAVVRPGDRVFHLGDVSLCRDLDRVDALLGRLAGQKFWILGNHDHSDERKRYAHRFQKVERMMDVRIGKGTDARDLVLCHFALLSWNKCHHGAWMLHGHSHGDLAYPFPAKAADVGVDVWAYAPVSFEEVRARLDPMPLRRHHDMPRSAPVAACGK